MNDESVNQQINECQANYYTRGFSYHETLLFLENQHRYVNFRWGEFMMWIEISTQTHFFFLKLVFLVSTFGSPYQKFSTRYKYVLIRIMKLYYVIINVSR